MSETMTVPGATWLVRAGTVLFALFGILAMPVSADPQQPRGVPQWST